MDFSNPTEFIIVPGPTGQGCYLVFEVVGEGMLFTMWSATPVEGALAFFHPTKAVPAFKYKEHGGKSELIRGFRGPTRSRFFEGWCQFLKLARDFNGDAVLLTTSHVSLWARLANGDVRGLPPGKPASLSLATAVSAVGNDDTSYHGVSSMTQDYFLGADSGDVLPSVTNSASFVSKRNWPK